MLTRYRWIVPSAHKFDSPDARSVATATSQLKMFDSSFIHFD